MRRAIVIVAFVAAVLGTLAIRVVVEGRRALTEGDDWMARGRPAEAIRAYETAARWYLPLAPHVDEAYSALRTLATRHATSDPAVALAAWRAIRGAARSTRSLWVPHADDLAAADEAIATISAKVPQAASTDPGWHRERLGRNSRAGVAMAALAGLGILLWIGGALALVRRGLTPGGALVRRPALMAGATIVIGVACWSVGLYNA